VITLIAALPVVVLEAIVTTAPATAFTTGSTPASATTTAATSSVSQQWRGDGSEQQGGENGC
jgi:hypothetical protein